MDSVQGTWIRTSWRWTEKTGDLSEKGFVHSSFLCDIEDEKCSDLQRFVDYFKDICKQYCYSRKSFEEGDAGIMWSKPAEFSLSESDGGYRLYLGTKYVPTLIEYGP
ncbi:MAG TPA: hypothetical protein PK453_11120 [Leptospiraceae bacterium]|nr:hypothetical protein [Leptospiraceae bacterium]HNH08159.1 hypothetical protein [Leptospiraceae bacterium]HNI98844.1 hypothetical protein [Leptospiraceae bacterium]HNM06224.1 hypothetical protein [Leptospiraceae bacterium]